MFVGHLLWLQFMLEIFTWSILSKFLSLPRELIFSPPTPPLAYETLATTALLWFPEPTKTIADVEILYLLDLLSLKHFHRLCAWLLRIQILATELPSQR